MYISTLGFYVSLFGQFVLGSGLNNRGGKGGCSSYVRNLRVSKNRERFFHLSEWSRELNFYTFCTKVKAVGSWTIFTFSRVGSWTFSAQPWNHYHTPITNDIKWPLLYVIHLVRRYIKDCKVKYIQRQTSGKDIFKLINNIILCSYFIPLQYLQFDLNSKINLGELSYALEQELRLEEEDNACFQAAIASYQQELKYVKYVASFNLSVFNIWQVLPYMGMVGKFRMMTPIFEILFLIGSLFYA